MADRCSRRGKRDKRGVISPVCLKTARAAHGQRGHYNVAAILTALALTQSAPAQAEPLLHPLFSDHAVLQRDQPIPVRGWAAPGERVTIRLGEVQAQSRADASGVWRATLPARPAGGPLTLYVRAASGASQEASDILVGDVYLCAGQSNMDFPNRYATNAAGLLAGTDSGRIRLFFVPRAMALRSQTMFAAPPQWRPANGEALGDFSAVCYGFAREIENAAQAPIGLLQSSWGGTRIEAWMSDAALRKTGGFEDALATLADATTDPTGAQVRYAKSLRAWWMQHDPGARAGWGDAALDDSSWSPLALAGGSWESSGASPLTQFDGAVWFRTDFTLSAQQAAQAATLTLGPIDDIDITFVNGTAVGAVSGWQTPRTYTIPADTLHAGRNTLAVGVLDTGGGGGLWGAPESRALHFADGSSIRLDGSWRYRISTELRDVTPPPNAPWEAPGTYTGLYNAMIAPLAPFGLRGVLWYQGESNVIAPESYANLLPAMMQDWRRVFSVPDLPFLIVQLANYGVPEAVPRPNSWGGLREAQRRAVIADPHAGLAVTIDVGDRFDIHPTQKSVVSQRLARIARRRIYDESIEDSGPTPIAARRAGDAVIVQFAHGSLVVYSNHRPTAFELCDARRACRFVDAALDGSRISLDARGLEPVFVRYCWADAPICNLYNDTDLPAVPFEIAVER